MILVISFGTPVPRGLTYTVLRYGFVEADTTKGERTVVVVAVPDLSMRLTLSVMTTLASFSSWLSGAPGSVERDIDEA